MNLDDNTRDEAAIWFAALRRGPMSLEEREAFDVWRASPGNQAALNGMHELWGEMASIGELGVAAPRPMRMRRLAAAVAAAAVLGGAGAFAHVGGFFDRTVQTKVGEQRVANLSDGSVVGLNVVTRVSYDMTPKERAVRIDEGEAVFYVKKDPARPFSVRAGDYEIRALGTAFNIRCRDSFVDVAVIEGLVSVVALKGPRAGEEITRVPAGQRLRLPETAVFEEAPAPEPTAVGGVAEWRLRVVGYEDTSVGTVVDDLNRFFERPIMVEDEALASRRITIRLEVRDRERTLRTLSDMLQADLESRERADLLVPANRS